MGPLRSKTLTLVLVATVVGAQRPPGANLSDGLTGTSDIPGLYGRPPTILMLAGAPQGHPGLSEPLRDTGRRRGRLIRKSRDFGQAAGLRVTV